jgi:hypothetical protein
LEILRRGLDGSDDGSGFVANRYQGLVVFKDYMSFVVTVTDDEGVETNYIVGDKKNENNV